MKDDVFVTLREEMVCRQILGRGIDDPKILKAFRKVPRHLFVPEGQRKSAYGDFPLPIGEGQTISQPYIVALMTLYLGLSRGIKILEIGTGSGYQSAICAFLGAQVYTVERFSSLARKAGEVLGSLGLEALIKEGDGTFGWPEQAPYDRIIVTAATDKIPSRLLEQLKIKGKMVIPLGPKFQQELTVVEKLSLDKIREEKVCGCIFVPLVGKYD